MSFNLDLETPTESMRISVGDSNPILYSLLRNHIAQQLEQQMEQGQSMLRNYSSLIGNDNFIATPVDQILEEVRNKSNIDITDEQMRSFRDQAQAIQDHFELQCAINTLGSNTPFNQSLCQLMESIRNGVEHIPVVSIGILYSLPELYDEEQALRGYYEGLKDMPKKHAAFLEKSVLRNSALPRPHKTMIEGVLRPVGHHIRQSKFGVMNLHRSEKIKRGVFVFRDSHDYAWRAAFTNLSCIKLMKMFFDEFAQSEFRVQGHATWKRSYYNNNGYLDIKEILSMDRI